MFSKKDILGFILLLIFIYTLVIVIKRDDYKEYRRNGIVTTAKVIKADSDYKGRLEVTYVFTVNKISYQNRRVFSGIRLSAINPILNKYFPVVYLKGNYNKNQLLLSPYNFNKMQIPFPDSLTWILKYKD
jgi:hypothetical protein